MKFHLQYCLYFLLLFVLLLSTVNLFGQASSNSNNFKHLTVDDGLSHATVNRIMEDHLGMLWVATRYGLNRYDGNEFKTFLPSSSSPYSIKAYEVLSLWEDPKGNIWAGHRDAGISVFERHTGQFKRFLPQADSTINWETISVKQMFTDHADNLWIGTFGGGAIVFDQTGNQIAHFCSYCDGKNRRLSNDFVFDFAADEQGRVWIGTAGSGMDVYDPSSDQLQVFYPSDNSSMEGFGKALVRGEQNQIWVGTAGSGLFVIDSNDTSIRRVADYELSSAMITDLEWRSSGELWIATDGGGITQFNSKENKWTTFSYDPVFPGALNTNAIYDLYFDQSGNFWVGTFNGGLNVRYKNTYPFLVDRRYAEERGLGLRSVLSMAAISSSEVLLGTDGGGLFSMVMDREYIQLKALPYPAKMPVITCILPADEYLWLGSFARGLTRYHPRTGTEKNFQYDPEQPESLAHNNVWDLVMEKNGNLWIGTLGGGVDLLPQDSASFQHFRPTNDGQGLSSVQVVDILLDMTGAFLWVATEDAGLNRIDLHTFEITQYQHDPNNSCTITSNQLQCLYQDQLGTLWVGTAYEGLCAINTTSGQSINYGPAEGLPRRINSIIEGPGGYLWLSSPEGIGRWNRHEAVYQPIGTDPYLKNNQYNARAVLQCNNDYLLFGSTNGYAIVLPEQIVVDTPLLQVWFTEASLSNTPLKIGLHEGRTILNSHLNDSLTTVQLRYTDKGLSFKFAANDFAQANEINYAYRLMGLDSTWQRVPAAQRFANYAALPGGTYELQVRAIDRNGNWSPSIRKLAIEVAPPFWETWWFALLSAVTGILLVFTIIRFLLHRQQARFERQAIEAEQKLLRIQNEHLEKDVANKMAQLNASVLQIAHKNEMLSGLKAQLQTIATNANERTTKITNRLLREIERELVQEDYWEQFQLAFNQSYQDFIQHIETTHPNLSSTDHRLCCFIKMRLRNKEIASILNVTVNGVEQSKYRLKKKVGLARDEDLNHYIQSFGQV